MRAMDSKAQVRPVHWMGSSKEDVRGFPDPVQDDVGYALWVVQQGHVPNSARPLKGFHGAVLEIVDDHDTDTYRAVYTVRFREAVYVLHCFQKKSASGARTSKQDVDLIRRRLQAAERHHRELYGSRGV